MGNTLSVEVSLPSGRVKDCDRSLVSGPSSAAASLETGREGCAALFRGVPGRLVCRLEDPIRLEIGRCGPALGYYLGVERVVEVDSRSIGCPKAVGDYVSRLSEGDLNNMDKSPAGSDFDFFKRQPTMIIEYPGGETRRPLGRGPVTAISYQGSKIQSTVNRSVREDRSQWCGYGRSGETRSGSKPYAEGQAERGASVVLSNTERQ